MCKITTKGAFDFSCKTHTGKKILCFMDGGEPVEVNFDKLEVNYNGIVRVLVTRKKTITEKEEEKTIEKDEYVSVGRLKPRFEEDTTDFNAACREIEIVSRKRKSELKVQQKAQVRRKEPLKRSA